MFHPNNMEFLYDTNPCYRFGWAAGHPLSKAPFGYGGPKIRSLLSTEIAPYPPWRKALLLLRRVAANLRLNMSGSGESGGGKKRSLPSSFSDHGARQPALKEDRSPFSKLLEGVVFVLSGFVNPERSILRSQALEMGAEYRPDWFPDCTLLVCAFANTPKFKQVQADCGTIVSKEWMSECYREKRLIEIDTYLMHAGKPWRRQSDSTQSLEKEESCLSPNPHMRAKKCASPKASSSTPELHYSPSKIKAWAIDDLKSTVTWLESQKEKPEPDEVQKIAAQGILTCLEDAIAALENSQGIKEVIEQWNFVPHLVEELIKLDIGSPSMSLSRDKLLQQAQTFKNIYQSIYDDLDNSPSRQSIIKKKEGNKEATDAVAEDDLWSDSDETIEMTEEEIEEACKGLVDFSPSV